MELLLSEVDRKNQLLTQLKDKTLTMNQFMEECYRWSLEPQIWQDIDVLSYPEPPKEWVEYENLSLKDRAKLGEEFFHQLPIKNYLYEKGRVYSQNYAHWDWLKQMKEFFPEAENEILHRKVDEKLEIFNSWLGHSTTEIDRVRKAFSAKEV